MLKEALLKNLCDKGMLTFDKEASDRAIDQLLDEALTCMDKYATEERFLSDCTEWLKEADALDSMEGVPAQPPLSPSMAAPVEHVPSGATFGPMERAVGWMAKNPVKSVGGAVVGLGLAAAAYSAWKRKQMGLEGISRDRNDPQRVIDELKTEALNREDEQRKKIEEFRSQFQPSQYGGYEDSTTGALIGEEALRRKIGGMHIRAEDERKRWYENEFKTRLAKKPYMDPDTGQLVNPMPEAVGPANAADVGFGEFKNKMKENRGLFRQIIGDPFIYKGNLVLGAGNPWRGMWSQDPYAGPNSEQAMHKYYNSTKTSGITGEPLNQY